MRGHGDELSRRVVMCQEFIKQSRSVSCRQVHAHSRWRTAALAHREDPRSITRKQVVCFKPTYFKTHARAVNNTIQQKIRANWARPRVYSSDFGFVYTFTPLLNETGRICLKTAHVAVTKPGALMMRVPFRSAPPYRPRQPVAGRGGGRSLRWIAIVVQGRSWGAG